MGQLILTALEEYWPENETEAVFLGPWCFAYNDKHKYRVQSKFTVVPTPWKTPQDIYSASRYIDSLIDRLMPSIRDLMNEFHGVSYSERYWRIVSIVWLVHWLSKCYDFYSRLELVPSIYTGKLSVVVTEKRELSIDNFFDYVRQATEQHQYSHYLLSDIIMAASFDFIEINNVCDNSNNALKDAGRQTTTYKDKLKMYVKSCASNLSDGRIVIGNVSGISFADRISLQLSVDPFYLFKRRKNVIRAVKKSRDGLRSSLLAFTPATRFEEVIKQIILRHLPDSLLVSHEISNEKGTQQIWIGNDIYFDEKALKIAAVVEKGGRWISSQHGGGYGNFIAHPLGKIEYETSGGFITWGWKNRHIYDAQYYPLPSPLLSKYPRHRQSNESICLVSTMLPAYVYRFHTALLPEDLIPYMKQTKCFLHHLDSDLLASVKYRPYLVNYGTGHIDYFSDILEEHQLFMQGNLRDGLACCKLAVFDHMATTYMEAFVMNTPTILFWDPKYFSLVDWAVPYFDRLRSAGILFSSPEDAAEKINSIWGDVQGWWHSRDVQTAKDEFCREFCWVSKDWKKEWVSFLRTLT